MNKYMKKAMLTRATALCVACAMMPSTFVFAQENTFVGEENKVENTFTEVENTTAKPDWDTEENQDKTVYYNNAYYSDLTEALKAAYMDTTTTGAKEIHCKPGADLGTMSHAHVADDLIIYGNGAHVKGDLEIDTYQYDRTTGTQQGDNKSYLDKDISVTVKDLNGISAWGQRNTSHKITLNFENCKNIYQIYFTGTTGDMDINVNNCRFDSESEVPSRKDTTIYSNANGTINVSNTVFNNIDVAFNMNHKVKGIQTINIIDTEFINCGQGSDSNKTYAAPVRVVAQAGATSILNIKNSKFTYSEGVSNYGNGDILLGDGRLSGLLATGDIIFSMSGTQADVMAQKVGYYDKDGNVANPDKATTTPVKESDTVKEQEVNVGKPIEVTPAPKPNPGGGSGNISKEEVYPVYRAYNPNNGEHLYTLDEKELKHVTSVGWNDEGIAFMAETDKNGQALFRVYNPNSGLHHYTLDENEKNTLVSLGWDDEGIAWYTSKKPMHHAVYRLYNPNDGQHHYTMDQHEKDVLDAIGWNFEGIAFRSAPISK